MTNSQVLLLPGTSADTAHGHSVDGVRGDELFDDLSLVAAEVQLDIVKGTLGGAQYGSLCEVEERMWMKWNQYIRTCTYVHLHA